MNIIFDTENDPNGIYRIPIHTYAPMIYYIDDARFYRMGSQILIGSINFRIDIEKAMEIAENPDNYPVINNAFFLERSNTWGLIPMMFTAIPHMPDVPPLFGIIYPDGSIILDLAKILSIIHTSEDIERYKEGYSSVRLHFSTFYRKSE